MTRLVLPSLLASLLALPVFASTTAIGSLERGQSVTISGTVDRITDEDEFRLRDASGTVRVYVGPNMVPVKTGEAVTVRGFVDDDPGPMEVYARSLTRADGTQVTFSHSYD